MPLEMIVNTFPKEEKLGGERGSRRRSWYNVIYKTLKHALGNTPFRTCDVTD